VIEVHFTIISKFQKTFAR